MSGLKLTIPTTFTDTSLPILRDDPVLSAGSLLLVDPAHSANPWSAGVPSNLQSVPNLARSTAKTLLGGTPGDADVDPIFEYGTAFAAGKGLLARSGKGGFDLVASTLLSSGNSGASFTMPTAVKQYVLDHLDNDYFVSMWSRITRPGSTDASGGPVPMYWGIGNTSAAGNNYVTFGRTIDTQPYSTTLPQHIGGRNIGPSVINAAGPLIRNVAVSQFTGTKPTTTAGTRFRFGVVGRPLDSFNNAMVATNYSPSYVFYRFYVEDLTVSGRSYFTVDQLDNAEFTKHVLTAGGRYYGDTFTDPATVNS